MLNIVGWSLHFVELVNFSSERVGGSFKEQAQGSEKKKHEVALELEGLEEAEEEEYSGPLLADEEDDDNYVDDMAEEQENQYNIDYVEDNAKRETHAYKEADADAAGGERNSQ